MLWKHFKALTLKNADYVKRKASKQWHNICLVHVELGTHWKRTYFRVLCRCFKYTLKICVCFPYNISQSVLSLRFACKAWLAYVNKRENIYIDISHPAVDINTHAILHISKNITAFRLFKIIYVEKD